MTAEDLVQSANCAFVATGITANSLLQAPQHTPEGWRTSSIVLTARHPGLFVDALPDLRGTR